MRIDTHHHDHEADESNRARFCQHCGGGLQPQEIHGRLQQVCQNCGRTQFRDPKVAAGVLVVQDGKVLLVQRSYEPQKRKWSIPAGFVDAGEAPAEAALRECLEETGLQVEIIGLLDVIAGREHPRGADIVIVYRARVLAGNLEAGDDAADARFFGSAALPELAFEATRLALASLSP